MQKNQKITIQEHLKINGLVCHSISIDCKFIAVSLKAGPSIEIYQVGELGKLSTWKLLYQLKEQQQQISSLDWFGNNTLLSTSFDRSVMVWQLKNNQWKKDLVIMQNSRALLCGEWSNNGKKFAVGGGDCKCFIGYFEEENDFWQTKKLESFKSSVTALAFHPSGRVIAIGSTDNTISLQTCYINEKYEDQGYSGNFSNVNTFKDILITLSDTGGWIEGITFSPSGNRFAFSCHNGTIQNGHIENNDVNANIYKVNVKKLPIKKLKYADENRIVVGGYDMIPYIFKYNNGEQLVFDKDLNECLSEQVTSNTTKIQQLQTQMFKTSQGQKTSGKHTTPINCITNLNNQGKNLMSTSDLNGTLLFWEI